MPSTIRGVFEVGDDGRYRARFDAPYSVLGSFLADEVGASDFRLAFCLESYSKWLDEATMDKNQNTFGGDAHGLEYDHGAVVVEHDYDLFAPARVKAEEFRHLLLLWRDFVHSGEKGRIVEL